MKWWQNPTKRKQPKFILALVCAVITATAPLSAKAQTEAQDSEQSPTNTKTLTPIARHHVDLEAEKHQRYLETFDAKTVVLVPSPSGDYVGLWEVSRSESQIGALLLAHAADETPDQPGVIKLLRDALPEHGWAVLSISLPDPIAPEIPKRPKPLPSPTQASEPDEGSEEQENALAELEKQAMMLEEKAQMLEKDAMMLAPPQFSNPEIEQLAHERLTSAIQFLNQRGQFNIVVAGEGTGAYRMARFVDSLLGNTVVKGNKKQKAPPQSANERPIRAMALVNARNKMVEQEPELFDFLNFVDLPILDVYLNQHFLDEYEPKDRKKRARENRITNYVQVSIRADNAEAFESENQVTRRIRGFLNRHAKGVEIK